MSGSLLDDGKFAFGVVVGGGTVLLSVLYWPSCENGTTSLWMCNEDPQVVLGVLDFIKGVVSAVVWPTVFLASLMVFRRNVKDILGNLRLRSFKGFGVEADFINDIDRAEDEIRRGGEISGLRDVSPSEKFYKFLQYDKKFAVVAAWIEIESKISELAKSFDVGADSRPFRIFSANSIQKLQLPEALTNAILELRSARNNIAHVRDVSIEEEQIIRYLDIAADIDDYLSRRIEESKRTAQ